MWLEERTYLSRPCNHLTYIVNILHCHRRTRACNSDEHSDVRQEDTNEMIENTDTLHMVTQQKDIATSVYCRHVRGKVTYLDSLQPQSDQTHINRICMVHFQPGRYVTELMHGEVFKRRRKYVTTPLPVPVGCDNKLGKWGEIFKSVYRCPYFSR